MSGGAKTVREAIAAGETLYVRCHNPLCTNRAKLDLEELGRRLGLDHGCMHDDIAHLFRCSKCKGAGRKRWPVGLTCIPNYDRFSEESKKRPVAGYAYRKAKGGD